MLVGHSRLVRAQTVGLMDSHGGYGYKTTKAELSGTKATFKNGFNARLGGEWSERLLEGGGRGCLPPGQWCDKRPLDSAAIHLFWSTILGLGLGWAAELGPQVLPFTPSAGTGMEILKLSQGNIQVG